MFQDSSNKNMVIMGLGVAGGGMGALRLESSISALQLQSFTWYRLSPHVAVVTDKQFSALTGRFELQSEVQGVKFINDTTYTTPIAGIKALEVLPKEIIILIVEGNTEQLPLTDFISAKKHRVKCTVLFDGTVKDEISSIHSKSSRVPIGDMIHAVRIEVSHSKRGDSVIFSSGATHLLIINEFERGDDLETQVKAL
jgi:UDP-N-acetylmuramoylalanine--D-glutamate ligase